MTTPPMASYPLVIPSLRFAGLLASWAAEHSIPFEHSVRHVKRPKIEKGKPVIMVFETGGDRARLLSIARAKIAALRTARCGQRDARGGRGKIHPAALNTIAARLEADYKAIS